MFARLFQNSFIITKSSMNGYISMNYTVSDEMLQETDTIQFLDKLSKISEERDNHKDMYPTFYTVQDFMFNPIMQQYCYYMGLDYESYQIIVEFALFYEEVFIRPYNPSLNNQFEPISVRKFSMVGQSIPWNYGIIPFEYWVNHKSDSYFNHVYHNILLDSLYYHIYEESARELNLDPHYMSIPTYIYQMNKFTKKFNTSKLTNYKWNSEFDIILYNKRLENHIRETNFILRNIEIDEDVKKRIEEDKTKPIERHENYDNISIYKNIPYDRSRFYK